MRLLPCASAAALLAAASVSHAIQVCELDGQFINPANGNMTRGKTGLMRCRDGEGGPVVREQELRNGVFMGVVRYFKDEKLQREFHVNERGNRDGVSREFVPKSGQVIREETSRNGTTVGIVRTWYESGQLKRVSSHDDKGKTRAQAEFTAEGKLSDLRCAEQPLLAPHADDAVWCGHRSGAPASVTLYRANGQPAGKLVHQRGERRYTEYLWGNGKPRSQIESTPQGRIERTYWQDGEKRREVHFAKADDDDRRQVVVLERDYHESGTLTRERQFGPEGRGAQSQLEQSWYLNGQPREKREAVEVDGRKGERWTRFHDNGRVASSGDYLRESRSRRIAVGVHKVFDADGRLRLERHHDARGRVSREREMDESGAVTRDDELFEDGSRKAYAR